MQSIAAMEREKKLSYLAAGITGYITLQIVLALLDKNYYGALTYSVGLFGSIGWLYAEYKLIWRV